MHANSLGYWETVLAPELRRPSLKYSEKPCLEETAAL